MFIVAHPPKGCDASVLLDSTPGSRTEKEHFINNPSLRGYEVIDEAKAELEAQCPQTVSCADILAFAARDSAYLLGGIKYAVQSGRRDGLVSLIDEPLQNLPAPFFDLQSLHQFFKRKGLSLEEMVTLSGAHSTGVSHCSAVTPRLYPSNISNPRDPLMDPKFSRMLKSKCPMPSDNSSSVVDQTVYEDFLTPYKLDNGYYQNVVNRKVLFTSDQMLMASPETATMVKIFGRKGELWARKFAKAMVHMGSIEVLTGCQGEIRKSCRAVNQN